MSTRLKVGLLFVILIIVTITTATIIHSQQNTYQRKKTINDEEVPITNYNKPLPADLQERNKREKRNRRRNLKLGPDTAVFNPKPFELTENRHSSYGGFEEDALPEPAIPAARSDTIVVGEIINGEAFLSEDRVSIYSEFLVRVDGILKNSTPEPINNGNLITISRGGGGVRFPSGKIIKRLFEGKPMPRLRSTYVLFLKYEPEGNDYSLITAYELTGGQVIPLDGLNKNGNVIYQLASHQSYRGMPATDFLNLVQSAISSSRDMF